MFGRSGITIGWQNINDLAIGATFYVDVGGWDSQFTPGGGAIPVGQFCAPINGLPYFAIDVQTDDHVEIDIQTGALTTRMATLATLVCPGPPLAHYTVYNLAPPFNQNGVLVLATNFVRLQVRNVSGNVVSPFNLEARSWN